jgi:hypothetical protein
LATLMMLAFLVDQTQQLCCALFRAVWEKLGSKRLTQGRLTVCPFFLDHHIPPQNASKPPLLNL